VIFSDQQPPRLRSRFASKLSLFGVLFSLACLLLFFGCSRDKEFERPAYAGSAFAPLPPSFITGAAAVLLTNVDGFSAAASFMADSLPASSKQISGELLGRDGKLLFAPDPAQAKKQSGGSFIFLWDVAAGHGYVLSEALQAFAPLSTSVFPTNVMTDTDSTALEKLEGHPSQEVRKVVQMSDGSSAVFRVWRALDLKQFPLRVVSATNTNSLDLHFSKVRLEAPSAALFSLPKAFTQYASAEALMTELIIRQHNLRHAPVEPSEPLYQSRERR
jgi:hypothetical protein